jgi:hypothetical protein
VTPRVYRTSIFFPALIFALNNTADWILQAGAGSVAFATPQGKDSEKPSHGNTMNASASGGGHGNGGEGFNPLPNSHHHDFREELRNSFHRSELNFPCYGGKVDPLPWLNHPESYF